MAPEVVREQAVYTCLVDVYSATLLMWYLHVGEAPFRSLLYMHVYVYIYVCIHMYVHIYMYTHVHVHI